MTNQRGVETSFADITVSLPSRVSGEVVLPAAPEQAQRSATAMYARHNELRSQQRPKR